MEMQVSEPASSCVYVYGRVDDGRYVLWSFHRLVSWEFMGYSGRHTSLVSYAHRHVRDAWNTVSLGASAHVGDENLG